MQSLWCQTGNHEWQRPSQRGRKPTHCPEHPPAVPEKRVMTQAQRVKAMHEGRKRKASERAQGAVQRVKDYHAWLAADQPLWAKLVREEISRDEYHAQRPQVPEIPTDADFDAARAVGVIA